MRPRLLLIFAMAHVLQRARKMQMDPGLIPFTSAQTDANDPQPPAAKQDGGRDRTRTLVVEVGGAQSLSLRWLWSAWWLFGSWFFQC
ncbi:hypothetical protein JZ751_012523 [Albula glossodonta]|uniref:Secreted protein n=1 Tax=Albula glossodonta TaxID=121402 RepID=A0A8T2NX17_9TELE|nr:hypothetical protein JZ751_012523 [Albula glossodonta]